VGITGSGVLQGVNEFLNIGAIKNSGSIDQHFDKKWFKYPRRIKLKDRLGPTTSCDLVLPELRVVHKSDSGLDSPITLNQNDIREVQLAKSAIRTGIDILITKLGISESEIDRIILAGAFGNYLDPHSAIEIGMLPDLEVENIVAIGNAAGTGAKLMIRSTAARKRAQKIANEIEYIDLATHKKFQDRFVKNMEF
jgi:uncharacterized 2Fe-2S/4Fe-4S cluster protein (DUF4445 family)